MNKILEQLYHGDVYPLEDMGKNVSSEECKCNHSIEEEREYLKKVLSPEDMKHFENWDDLQKNSTAYFGFENFKTGFRLGAMLMMETLLPDNN